MCCMNYRISSSGLNGEGRLGPCCSPSEVFHGINGNPLLRNWYTDLFCARAGPSARLPSKACVGHGSNCPQESLGVFLLRVICSVEQVVQSRLVAEAVFAN